MSVHFKVCVVTTSRADYSIYKSVLETLQAAPSIGLSLIVGGTHLSADFGETVTVIEKDGYEIAARVPSVPADDSDVSIAMTMGEATLGFAQALGRLRPDLVLVLGDRYEMHSAAAAALPLLISVGHIHGGEETEGAMDNSLRHSMTKLSHLHFCSTALAARRICAMGESPENIVVSGAPALDSILKTDLMPRADLMTSLGLPDKPFNLMTYHPVTLTPERTLQDFDKVWSAVKTSNKMCVITLSNADTYGRQLNERLAEIAESNPDVFLVHSMGTRRYYSAMHHADMMIGNSSSGVIEAASFGLPVVNIGDRQKGREVSSNLIQTETDISSIKSAMAKALTPEFQKICQKRVNVYGNGVAADIIVAKINAALKAGISVQKRFHLLEGLS